MVAGPTLKSSQITNLDSTPIVANTAGKGAPTPLQGVDGTVTAAAADGAGTKYLLNRVRSDTIVKKVEIASEAQGAGKVDVGVYYPDDIRYMAPGNSANLGLVIDADRFASDVDLASKVDMTDVTLESGVLTIDKLFMPLWQAAGLSTDPGGWLDIVATVHTTDVTTGTGKIYLRTSFVTP